MLMDPLLPTSDATEGALVVPMVVAAISTSLSEKSTSVLSPMQHVVPSTSELEQSEALSFTPDSQNSVTHLLAQMVTEGPTLKHDSDIGEGSQLEPYSEDSPTAADDRSLASVRTETTPSTIMPRPVHCYIPPEITNEIIDSLIVYDVTERVTLCRCALVCKDWLPASRRRLFYHIDLWQSPTRYDLFVSRVLRCDLEKMKPWLAHVRELRFCDGDLWGRELKKLVKERGHRLVHEFSGRFPNLFHIEFCQVDWGASPRHRSAYMKFFNHLHSLQVLRLDTCRFPSFFAFWRTVAALPSLTDLTLFYVYWPSTRTGSPIISQALAHWAKLHTFSFSFARHRTEPNVHTLLSWLSQTSTPSSIRSLTCYWVSSFTQNPEFFQAVGGSVTELSVLDLGGYGDDPLREDGLSSFSQLESLHLERGVHGGDWRHLIAVLQNIPSPSHLRRLTIWVPWRKQLIDGVEGNHKTEDEGPELLDAVFDRDSFTSLEYVQLNIHGYNFWEAGYVDEAVGKSMAIQAWEKKLPKLHARGIMKLDLTI